MHHSDAGRAVSVQLHRVRWFLHAHLLETKLRALRYAVKANFNPNQPRVPAGHGRESGRWTSTGGGGSISDGAGSSRRHSIRSLSDIPKERPESTPLRNAVFKLVAREVLDIILVRAQLRGLVGAELRSAVHRVLIGLEVASWVVKEGLPSIASYLDPPRTLEELRDAVSRPRAGYEIHHIVERNSAGDHDSDRINSPENLVRIPTFKHHQITGWYMSRNRDYEWRRPRDVLREEDWETRFEVGLKALVDYGVLKP